MKYYEIDIVNLQTKMLYYQFKRKINNSIIKIVTALLLSICYIHILFLNHKHWSDVYNNVGRYIFSNIPYTHEYIQVYKTRKLILLWCIYLFLLSTFSVFHPQYRPIHQHNKRFRT